MPSNFNKIIRDLSKNSDDTSGILCAPYLSLIFHNTNISFATAERSSIAKFPLISDILNGLFEFFSKSILGEESP